MMCIHFQDYWMWMSRARKIYAENRLQDSQMVKTLGQKWNDCILYNRISPWSLFLELARVVDETDNRLVSKSQFYHSMQTFEAMLLDTSGTFDKTGEQDPELLFLGLMHDIGKVLVLFGETQANVMCSTFMVDPSMGVVSWNHDELGYQKFCPYLPEHMLWVIRYHSLDPIPKELEPVDPEKSWSLMKRLKYYDKGFKSMCGVKTFSVEIQEKARMILEQFLPNPMIF